MNKRRVHLLLALLLCFVAGAWADNTVKVSSAEGVPDGEVSVSLSLTNSDAASSLQVSIPLDDNLTLVEGSGQPGERCPDHAVTVGVKDGVLNVLIYSMSMTAMTGNDGVVASFRLKLGNQPKTSALTPSKVKLNAPNGDELPCNEESGTVTARCAKAQYSTMAVDFGRVPIRSTYTQSVTVTNVGNADLVITRLTFSDVNVWSSTTALPVTVAPGRSHTLNVTYAPVERGHTERTLKVECNSISKLNTITLKADPFAVNELHVQSAEGISDEEVTVHLTMNNMDAISGYQVEFELPDQLEYVNGSFALSDRKADHVTSASLNGKTLRILVYSPNDKPMTGNDGEIGSFKVKLVGRYSTELTPTKTVLSATINNKVENVMSAVYGGQITIRSPRINTDNALDFGAVSVTEAAEKPFIIRNSGNAPLTVNRIVFDNGNLTVKENLPLVIPAHGSGQMTVVYGSLEEKSFEATMQIYSNDPDQRLTNVQVTGSRFAPNYFEVATPDVYNDEDLKIQVAINTYDAISGIQFDVIYPNTVYEPYDNNIEVTARAEGMTVTSRQISDNTIRYFCYLLDGNGIAAGEGDIVTIKMKPVNGNVPEGNYSVQVKNIKLGTKEMSDKYAGVDTEETFHVKRHNPVTITATDVTRAYGDKNPTFTFSSEGADVVGQPEITCEATEASPIGTYPIIISKGSVENEEDTYVNGTLTITKVPLSISGGTYTKKQGDALPILKATYEGFKNNETESVLTKKPTLTTPATAASAPGTYDVTASGAEAQNYEISYVKGTLTVTQADPVKVTAKSYTRMYGDANPTFEFTSEGKTLEGTPEITCEATAASPVGTYPIVIKKGSVLNYNDTYVNGTLTITKAPLTISAGNYTMNQREELPEFEATYEGFKNGETSDVLTKQPVIKTNATSESEPGEYELTVSGAQAQNYEISYVKGTLTVVRVFNRADVNRDGVVDSADIVAVIKEMPDGDMKADVNNDGAIDSADIVAVIKAMK